jgi:hypothetical protein
MVKVLCDKCKAEVELTAKKIKEICTEQYRRQHAVLPPQYCLQCEGCALKGIIEAIAQSE